LKLIDDFDKNNDIIDIDNATGYLLNRKIIDTYSIVNGDLKIIDASRKNRNIKVLRTNDQSFLIKQSYKTDLNSSITLKREALLYALVQNYPKFSPLLDIVPHIHDFDENKNIILVEFIDGYSWNEYIYLIKDKDIGKETIFSLGKIIGTYHDIFKNMMKENLLNFLPRSFENSFLHPGPEIFINLSPANRELLKIIQRDLKLYGQMEEIFLKWSPQTLIHGDIKFDNIILSLKNKEDLASNKKIVIVDWETASMGNPAWDIGSVFQEFIKLWLSIIPITGLESSEQLLITSAESFKKIQSSMRVFWEGYISVAAINKSSNEINTLLIQSTEFCAVRLIQSIYEMNLSKAKLDNRSIYMIQISLNILKNVDNAVIHLLGIPFKFEI